MISADSNNSLTAIMQEALTALTIALAHLQLIRMKLERGTVIDSKQLVLDVRRAERALLTKSQRLRDLEAQFRTDAGNPK